MYPNIIYIGPKVPKKGIHLRPKYLLLWAHGPLGSIGFSERQSEVRSPTVPESQTLRMAVSYVRCALVQFPLLGVPITVCPTAYIGSISRSPFGCKAHEYNLEIIAVRHPSQQRPMPPPAPLPHTTQNPRPDHLQCGRNSQYHLSAD